MGNQIEVVVVLEDIRICKNAAVTRRLCNNLREKTCECKCYLIFFLPPSILLGMFFRRLGCCSGVSERRNFLATSI